MKKNHLSPLLLALFLAIGCKQQNNESSTQAALPIEVATPIIQDITLTKEYPGYLDADATVALVGRVSGTLQTIAYNPGDWVKKGQLLFVIEPTLYQDAVKQAEASLKTAQATLDYARNNYQRMQEAIKSDAVSRISFLQAESNMAQAEASVHNAEAALRSAQTNLSYCYVRAPFDGEVSRSAYSAGTYISGSVSPITLASIYKTDRMYTYFNISDNQWLTQLLSTELSQQAPVKPHYVTVTLGQQGGKQWRAKLDYLSPNISMNTGTIEVRAELENRDESLKTGGYIQVTLPYGKQQNAVLVPDASISTNQLGKFLYVVNSSDEVVYRPVETGQLVNDTLRWIKSGLAPNERYVTKALLKVRNGMRIHPITARQAAAMQSVKH